MDWKESSMLWFSPCKAASKHFLHALVEYMTSQSPPSLCGRRELSTWMNNWLDFFNLQLRMQARSSASGTDIKLP